MSNTQEGKTEERKERTIVLVCLSSSPSNKRVIRAASKIHTSSKEDAMALYVGKPGVSIDDDLQLQENMQYARECGFDVHTALSNDIALTIAEFVKRAKVTDLFLGYSAPSLILSARKSITEQVMSYLPEVNIHIIPDTMASSYPQMEKRNRNVLNLRDFLILFSVMVVATLLSLWFDQSRFSNANIITIYILAVLIVSLSTSHTLYGILSAVLYILLFNFLFIEPRFTLLVYNSEYLMTYFVSVLAALLTGTLTSRMKTIARRSAENAYQAKLLLDTSNQIEKAADENEIIKVTCMQLVRLLNRTVIFRRGKEVYPEDIFSIAGKEIDQNVFTRENEAAEWTAEHQHYSGAFTSHFPDFQYRYFSIHADQYSFGVLGIDMDQREFTEFENVILLSILHELTMALEKERIAHERQQAEIRVENERLKAGLLRSISHDLRTPLTSIAGNATNLLLHEQDLAQEDKQKIYEDMHEDSLWLNDQMENILAMTKLENSTYLHFSTENIDDVIDQALRHIQPHPHHTIIREPSEDDLFAVVDSKMIMQVVVNLVNNAIKYTPAGSTIRIYTKAEPEWIRVYIEDNGDGISDEDKKHIFELFYTGTSVPVDSYRRMGIGLNLCEMIMQAHGGTIEVYDHLPKGAVFCFSLKRKEVEIHE